jgi:hypothetical protein
MPISNKVEFNEPGDSIKPNGSGILTGGNITRAMPIEHRYLGGGFQSAPKAMGS